jgi:hypothetical protein
MACPLTAGMGADFVQFYQSTFGSVPSPALIKAALINGAVDMGMGYPSYAQGWGRTNLRNTIEGPSGGSVAFLDQTDTTPVGTGDQYTKQFLVTSSSVRLKITLVWTDPPGSFGCSDCEVNDLNLEVSSPEGTVYHGNQFTGSWSTAGASSWDADNNVENVFVQNPATGLWTIHVTGFDVGTLPQGVTGGQDYVLVYSGAIAPPCTAPEVPSGLSAAVPGDNEIDLTWSAGSPAGSTYNVYRTTGSCPGSGYSLLASGVASTSYSDMTVSGGTSYAYEVTAVDSTGGCESAVSNCDSATATGVCTAAPAFAGLSSVTNSANATCELDLSWSAATPNCGTSVYYNVYRSTSSSFVPSTSNRIATGVVGTTFTDIAGLTFNVPYYYVVRAVDASNGVEDANSVAISGTPLGPVTDGTFAAGAESGDPAMYTGGSSGQWYLTTSMAHSGTSSYWSGYNNSECSYLVTPSLALTASKNSTLTYWTAWNIEDRYDGGVVEISTDGGASWARLTPSPDYPGKFRYSPDACGYATNTPCYTGTTSSYLTFAQYSVDLSAYNGQPVLVRWDFSTDGSVTGQGWFVDDISITHVQTQGTCTTGASPGSVKPVPDGKWVSGTPMQASKAAADGSTVDLTWDVGTCQDANYNLYYGNGSDVSTYALQGSDCGLGNSGTASGVTLPAVPSGQTFIWWVIAGTDGVQTESSWGRDSTGNERHPAASNQCGMTAKSTATSCP